MGVPVIQPLPVEASLLGESPFWHPDERALWWCDIPGHRLNRYHPATGERITLQAPVPADFATLQGS